MIRSKVLRSGARAAAALTFASFFGTTACSSDAPGTDTGADSTRQHLQSNSNSVAFATAPDPTETGPETVTSAEYQFPAAVDPDVHTVATELWARVYRPENLGDTARPLVVFLHGNHSTCGTGSNPRVDNNCSYTSTGTCPSTHVVVPNHLGYAYIAEKLASHGYVVVSINANRGITCGGGVSGDSGLNLARGRLILKHLQRLSEWNANGGTPASLGVELQGKLDFSQLGLVGHSRGGEGIRAALNQYRDSGSAWPSRILSPVTFRGLFEIGPVDGQTGRVLNADGTPWSVLLPMCDGDVSNLQGVKPYDRMLQIPTETPATEKSTFTVWGANHNFYNTEWQRSDASGCTGHTALFPQTMGSPEQRTTGLYPIMGFVRGNVGTTPNPAYNQLFNPMFAFPEGLASVTPIDRGFTDSPAGSVTAVFEDFDKATGTSSYDQPNDAQGITIAHNTVPRHAPTQKAGVISWTAASDDAYFQTNWSAQGEGRDLSDYKTLDLRVSRQDSTSNPTTESTNFAIRLVHGDGTLSEPVFLKSYTDLRGPVGGPGGKHPILQSARVKLTDFVGASLTSVRGVRFVFNATATGAIYLANVRLSRVLTEGSAARAANFSAPSSLSNATVAPFVTHTKGNAIRSIHRVGAPHDASGGDVEIELESGDAFPVRDELAVLQVGGREFSLSRYAGGDTSKLVFTVPSGDFGALPNHEDVTVHYGAGDRWVFPKLDKAALR